METSDSIERRGSLTPKPSNSSTTWANLSVTGNIKIIQKHEGENPALSCAVLHINKEFATGMSDGNIEIRDLLTSQVLEILHSPKGGSPVTCISANESDKSNPQLLASYASGYTMLWDVKNNESLLTLKADGQHLVNTFNIDFRSFAVGNSDGKIQIHDTQTGVLCQMLQGTLDPKVMDGHINRVFALRFHPTKENELLTGGWDDTVQFWDVRCPYSRKKIYGPHICGNGGIEFWGEEKFMTASWKKQNPLQVWNYATGELEETLKPDKHNCFLYCCTYMESDSIFLIGGSHNNMLRVVDVNSKMTTGSVRNLKGAVYFAKELPKNAGDFKRNVCFCSGNSIYIAEVGL